MNAITNIGAQQLVNNVDVIHHDTMVDVSADEDDIDTESAMAT